MIESLENVSSRWEESVSCIRGDADSNDDVRSLSKLKYAHSSSFSVIYSLTPALIELFSASESMSNAAIRNF